MAYELYQTLELLPGVSAEEIKRAYYKLVRQYSPEKHPERFQRIREAYETLGDVQARQDYDALQQHGEEVTRLVAEAEVHIEESQWEKAIPLLKKVLVLFPRASGARHLLGVCYLHLQDWRNALKTYHRLVTENPEEAFYHLNYGYTFKYYGDILPAEDTGRTELYTKAREEFIKAIELEPFNCQPYLAISRTYEQEQVYDLALDWAEKAITADGQVDFQDFDILFHICIIYLRSGQLDRLEEMSERIISLLPNNDPDVLQFVARRFAEVGFDLGKYGYDHKDFACLKAAASFLEIAQRFDSEDAEIQEIQDIITGIVGASDSLDSLHLDAEIYSGFYRLSLFCLASKLNHELEDRERIFQDILNEVSSNNYQEILSSLQKIKTNYYPIYQLDPELFNAIEERMIYLLVSEQKPKYFKTKFNKFKLLLGLALMVLSLVIGNISLFLWGVILSFLSIEFNS
jgi:curved DNA-binding protein CbpA